MDEYVLYLDESWNKTHFLIGGLIIKKERTKILERGLRDVKRCIWDDAYINEYNPILHCVDLTRIKDYRSNKIEFPKLLLQYPAYSVLGSKTKEEIKCIYDNVYSKLCKLLKDLECVIIGCIIDKKNLSFIYDDSIKYNDDLLFDITFNGVIENYSHFLLNNNAVGNIIYESRNGKYDLTENSKDYKMFDMFCKIKSCNKGITFCDEKTIKKTIRYLDINSKNDDIAGLQFADFIAYNLLKCEKIVDEATKTEFMKKLINRLYNGKSDISVKDLRWYFGLKRIPFDFNKMYSLEKELDKLKKSYENIKATKKNLAKKKGKLEQSIQKLIEENKILKEGIDNKQ